MLNLSYNILIHVWFLSYFYWCIISTKWQNKQKTKSTLSYLLEISQIMLKLLLVAASKKSDLVVAILTNLSKKVKKFLSSYLLLIITSVVQLFFLRDLVQICSIFLWWVVLLVFTSSLSKGLNQIGKVQLNWLMAPDPLRSIFFKGC